jgi:tRNA dimethylallyltransferase
VPILAGGTGFFLRALTRPIFGEPPLDPGRRRALKRWLAGLPRAELARWARALDPARAELAVQGGPQRLARTLEVALLTGRPLSWWHRHAAPEGEALDALVAVVELPKSELDRRIGVRVRAMLDAGLVEEVRGLLARGYTPQDPGMTGVGYREIAQQLAGELSPEEASERIERATRAYARRQATWLRNQLDPGAVVIDGTAPLAERVERVVGAWAAAQRTGRPGGGGE